MWIQIVSLPDSEEGFEFTSPTSQVNTLITRQISSWWGQPGPQCSNTIWTQIMLGAFERDSPTQEWVGRGKLRWSFDGAMNNSNQGRQL